MIGGVVEIAESDRCLRTERGFLVVESTGKDRSVLAQIDYDQFDALICSNTGFLITGPLLAMLAEKNKFFIVCGRNYNPLAVLVPLSDNFESIRRIQSQLHASLPLKKRLWQKLVQEKLRNQAALLFSIGKEETATKIEHLAFKVLSGDSDNKEAYAARLYWPALFGNTFLRSNEEDPVNAFLNYGYAILRSCICRAIVGYGLLTMFGVHHANLRNYFALADDILEPFRPLVDRCVYSLIQTGKSNLDPDAKRILCSLLIQDVAMEGQTMPLTNAIRHTVGTLVLSYEQKKVLLCLPGIMDRKPRLMKNS
ncbi:MAG: type II CRISPR-associated endonuclease Cas1 [Spirochaetaceae bacterium]|nr:type II CRISPR-associated endonuclease Cas1 [Spirochaetaceae bacterium]